MKFDSFPFLDKCALILHEWESWTIKNIILKLKIIIIYNIITRFPAGARCAAASSGPPFPKARRKKFPTLFLDSPRVPARSRPGQSGRPIYRPRPWSILNFFRCRIWKFGGSHFASTAPPILCWKSSPRSLCCLARKKNRSRLLTRDPKRSGPRGDAGGSLKNKLNFFFSKWNFRGAVDRAVF